MASHLERYRIGAVIGDKYAGEWVPAPFKRHGITYRHATQTRSETYLELHPLLATGHGLLLDHPTLLRELRQLERRTSRQGRDTVDHPSRLHDDHANAAALALVAAGTRRPCVPKIRKPSLRSRRDASFVQPVSCQRPLCAADWWSPYAAPGDELRAAGPFLVRSRRAVQWLKKSGDRDLPAVGCTAVMLDGASIATHLLEAGCNIRTAQELLGHRDVRTTMTDTNVLDRGGLGVVSPIDAVLGALVGPRPAAVPGLGREALPLNSEERGVETMKPSRYFRKWCATSLTASRRIRPQGARGERD